MSQPHLDSNHFGTKITNGTTSPIDSIPDGTKTPDPIPLTRPTYLSTRPTDSSDQKGKSQVPGDPEPDPSLSDPPSNKSNLSNDTNSSK